MNNSIDEIKLLLFAEKDSVMQNVYFVGFNLQQTHAITRPRFPIVTERERHL